jgi:hypothetical protein
VPGKPSIVNNEGARFELYRLAVEMADRVSSRRATANAFFLTLQTALAGFAGIVRTPRPGMGVAIQVDSFGIMIVAVVGLILAGTWWLLLRSYRDLNEAKFKVINAMEKDLPLHPFSDEWDHLKGDPIKKRILKRYAELNVVERVVPAAFAIVYVVVGIRALAS